MDKQMNNWKKVEVPHQIRTSFCQDGNYLTFESACAHSATLMSHWTDSSRGVYPDKDRHFQELSPREFLIWEFKEVDGERLIYGVLEGFLFETFENAEAALSKMVLMEDDPNEGYDEEFSHDEEAWREIKNLEIAASAF